jgi:hypothetical protein
MECLTWVAPILPGQRLPLLLAWIAGTGLLVLSVLLMGARTGRVESASFRTAPGAAGPWHR